ncbi:hypothetical protein TNCV_3270341 [Trichonephila clavipes]|uniref:Uncharacterized protein n=1 Tax=Trichonephila clavipes TaxID=2585209 RepID=A0A8X6S0E8_TRICX|nr:hypothetical protein TNCV_3270341 [Trichonephila clavipes]
MKLHYSATRGLLTTDLLLLNHGQDTRTTPELTSHSINFHITPMGGHLSLGIFNKHLPLCNVWSHQDQGRTHDTPAPNLG